MFHAIRAEFNIYIHENRKQCAELPFVNIECYGNINNLKYTDRKKKKSNINIGAKQEKSLDCGWPDSEKTPNISKHRSSSLQKKMELSIVFEFGRKSPAENWRDLIYFASTDGSRYGRAMLAQEVIHFAYCFCHGAACNSASPITSSVIARETTNWRRCTPQYLY